MNAVKSGLKGTVVMANSTRLIVDARTESRQAAAAPADARAQAAANNNGTEHHGDGLAHSAKDTQRSFREVKCHI